MVNNSSEKKDHSDSVAQKLNSHKKIMEYRKLIILLKKLASTNFSSNLTMKMWKTLLS